MKFFKVLTLAAVVMVGSAAWANPAYSMDVKFAKGANSAELVGTIRGYDYDSYHFWAKKGQLLSIEMRGSDPQIQTALFFKNKANSSHQLSQVLPYTGQYELRVLQSRNEARKSNRARQYNLELKIVDQRQSGISYTCDSGKKMSVQYKELQGKNPVATVQYHGHNYHLTFDRRYSKRDELMVFTNQNYILSLDRSQPKERAEVYSFSKKDSKGNAAIITQNCQPR